MFSLLSALFITIRREEEGGGRGGRWALACAAHQVKQILCKGSIVFPQPPVLGSLDFIQVPLLSSLLLLLSSPPHPLVSLLAPLWCPPNEARPYIKNSDPLWSPSLPSPLY